LLKRFLEQFMSEVEERATIKVEIEIDTEDHAEMDVVEDVVDEEQLPSEEERKDADLERRSAVVDIAVRGVDEKKRTVSIAVSSELPVERSFGKEILVHESNAIDMAFLSSGRAPLLLDHDMERQIGVIESVGLDADRVLRANVRFGRSALAQEIFSTLFALGRPLRYLSFLSPLTSQLA